MQNGTNIMVLNLTGHPRQIADISFDKWNIFRNSPAKSRRQIIDDDCLDAMIPKRKHGVTSNIAGAARNENRQAIQRFCHGDCLSPDCDPEKGREPVTTVRRLSQFRDLRAFDSGN